MNVELTKIQEDIVWMVQKVGRVSVYGLAVALGTSEKLVYIETRKLIKIGILQEFIDS